MREGTFNRLTADLYDIVYQELPFFISEVTKSPDLITVFPTKRAYLAVGDISLAVAVTDKQAAFGLDGFVNGVLNRGSVCQRVLPGMEIYSMGQAPATSRFFFFAHIQRDERKS